MDGEIPPGIFTQKVHRRNQKREEERQEERRTENSTQNWVASLKDRV